MTKLKFLLSLHEKLSGLPQQDVEERLNFYSEMIEDRMEEGLSEDEAVAQVGSVDEIAAQIAADIPAGQAEVVKKKRRLAAWEIILLALGCPIWLSLLIAAFSVTFSLYVVIWSVVISLWAVFGAVCGSAIGAGAIGIVQACYTSPLAGIAIVSAGLVCAGVAIYLLYICNAATKGTLILTQRIARLIKTYFQKRRQRNG